MPEFKKLRKKARRRRMETFLLAGYALAVTCALFVSLINNDDDKKVHHIATEDDYDFSSEVMTPAFSDAVQSNPFDLLYDEVNNLNMISEQPALTSKLASTENNLLLPVQPKPKRNVDESYRGIYQREHRVYVIAPGDTFISILTGLGMEYKNANDAYNALKKVYDAKNLRAGQHIEFSATFDVQYKELETLDSLIIEPVRGTKYILKRNEYDKFEAFVEQEEFAYEVKDVTGQITGNVSASLSSAGIPAKLSSKVVQIFSSVLNFKTDIKKGDSFEVKYEVRKDSDGKVVRIGDVLYASFKTASRTYKQYRYKSRNGDVGYYDEKGGAKKSMLDKKPMAARNARISSLFGYRRHPIYKTVKFHSGVDYAAPSGTAIYASGAGTVKMAQYVNGYGNFVKIKHNAEYETTYGHMQKFATGIRPGVHVKQGQIIGYVGSTGRSTGPHLHFEILKKGQRIDPLKAKVATGNDLTGGQLSEFKRIVNKLNSTSVAKIAETDVDLKVKAEKEQQKVGNKVADKAPTEKTAKVQNNKAPAKVVAKAPAKSTAKRTTAKPATRATAKKATAKKAPVKTVAKAPVKSTAKKTTAKSASKATAKKVTAKKAPAKTVAKTPAKSTTKKTTKTSSVTNKSTKTSATSVKNTQTTKVATNKSKNTTKGKH